MCSNKTEGEAELEKYYDITFASQQSSFPFFLSELLVAFFSSSFYVPFSSTFFAPEESLLFGTVRQNFPIVPISDLPPIFVDDLLTPPKM